MSNAHATDPLLRTLPRVAERKGFPARTLRALVVRGEIPAVNVSSPKARRATYYLDERDVDRWVERKKREARA